MKRLTLILAIVSATSAPARAQDTAPRPALADVMDGAVAMTTVAGGFLFVTGADGAWVCAINANPKHFAALIAGDDVVAEQTVPGAYCVPADHFKNLAE